MAANRDPKRQALRRLARIEEGAQALEFELRLQGNQREADEVDARAAVLAKHIDLLLKETMENWLESAADIEAELKAAGDGLQQSIRDIQRKVKTAENIVKAIGFIDDAVSIAGKVVAPL